jgi:hypothetical protein
VLVRILLVVALLAGWQAALEHPIQHLSHQESALCDAFDALAACAPDAPAAFAAARPDFQHVPSFTGAPRVAQAPPFLSQGPPLAAV